MIETRGSRFFDSFPSFQIKHAPRRRRVYYLGVQIVFRIFFVTIAAAGVVAGCGKDSDSIGGATDDSVEPADIVFLNGQIYTVNDSQEWAEAVAVRGDEILYVGDSAGVVAFVGDGTESVDLEDRMMLPGFIDGHIHGTGGGLLAVGPDLLSDDKEEVLRRVRKEADANPDADVILGWAWRPNVFPSTGPRKEDLDAIDSERPIYLWGIDGHSAWVNSRALEIVGVDKDFPDTQPPFSYYQRDEDGTPTGWVVELPAQIEVLGKLRDLSPAGVESGVRDWMPRYAAAGITSLFDAGIQGMTFAEGYGMYQNLENEGALTTRVFGSLYWNNPEVNPLPELRQLRADFNSELVKVLKLKVNADSSDEKWNAFYVDPYNDRPDSRGEPIIPEDVLTRVMIEADADGIDLFCHCWGDAATRMFLDAVEAAIETNPDRARRHTISHTALVHPEDVPRFAELGVIGDYQTSWAVLDPIIDGITNLRIGTARRDRFFGVKELADAGAHISLSSDWPVAGYALTHEPLVTIQVAVTRQAPEPPRNEPLGGEAARLPLADAIRAHTLGQAYALADDDRLGSIEVGKKADLIVLGKNLFEVDMYEISQTAVQLTMMNGNVTHRDGI